jgi:hypothetical protein
MNIPSGKCPKCEKVVTSPIVKTTAANASLSSVTPAGLLLIECENCHTILGTAVAPMAIANAVKAAMKTAN